MQISDELLSDFISEAWESIEKIDTGILLLEKTPEDKKILPMFFEPFIPSREVVDSSH